MNQELRAHARSWAQGILQRTVDSTAACRALVDTLTACGEAITGHPAVLVLRGVESELDVFQGGVSV